MKTPVAFLVFNRPDCTRQTFAAIRNARPERLLIVADGPRPERPGEAELCAEVRAIVTDGVDWPCQVETDWSQTNAGCRARISSGLGWVFSMVEEAIILEDDCVPHSTFFPFCEELLARYRDDPRVMMIAGANFDPRESQSSYSYRFSRICHVWGWASWRRAWQFYDPDIRLWPEFRDNHRLDDIFRDPAVISHWAANLEGVYNRSLDTWDYQLSLASFARNAVNVVANTNLVTNIGFAPSATHTTSLDDPRRNIPAEEMKRPMRHPPFVLANTASDERVLGPRAASWRNRLRKLKGKLFVAKG